MATRVTPYQAQRQIPANGCPKGETNRAVVGGPATSYSISPTFDRAVVRRT